MMSPCDDPVSFLVESGRVEVIHRIYGVSLKE